MISCRDVFENIIGIGLILGFLYLIISVFDIDKIQQIVERSGIWAPIVIVLAKAGTIVLAPLSGGPIYPIAGVALGFWKGLGCIVLGDILGGSISFWISRRFGTKIVEKIIRQRNVKTLNSVLSAMSTTRGFLFARVCFAAMPEIVCYAAGLTKLKFSKFLVVHVLVGVVPAAILVGSGDLLIGHNTTMSIVALVIASIVAVGFGWLFIKYAKSLPTDTANDSQ